MKRFLLFGVLLATWLFISAQSAMALGIDITAKVNPNWNNSWNEPELMGTALYTIKVLPDSTYGADSFEVAFEGNIFDTTKLEMELLSPSGWIFDSYVLGDNTYCYADSPTAGYWGNPGEPILVNPGGSISFLMKYTLLSEDRYDQARDQDLGWAWDNGIPWAQGVTALNTSTTMPSRLGEDIHPSGGTVTMHAPEPATMLLLGSGLIGLGWVGRRKVRG